MDIESMSAEQVARELSEIDGAFGALDGLYTREGLLEREAALRGRQMIVGAPLRGVSLDLALAGDRDWTEREVEAVELARQNEGLRFELTVAHGALQRIVDAQDALDAPQPIGMAEYDQQVSALEAAIIAAREIVGGAS